MDDGVSSPTVRERLKRLEPLLDRWATDTMNYENLSYRRSGLYRLASM